MPDDRPNLLFVLTDQQRHDWVGTDPEVPVRTPALDGLGERGVHFTNALCPAPLCAPSRSALAAGLEYPAHGVWANQDYPDRPTLYGRLREAGYHTVGVGDIDLHMDSPTWGLEGTHALDAMGFDEGVEIPGKRAMLSTYRRDLSAVGALEFDPDDLPPDVDPAAGEPANAYMAYLREEGLLEDYVEDMTERLGGEDPLDCFALTRPAPLPDEAYVDNWVGRQGLRFLESAPEDRPWALVVNFVGPHEPMDVTEEMHGWYRDPDVEFPAPVDPGGELDARTHQEIRRNYAAICENVDRWLGRYLEALADRGERGETVVAFASDHGELLGDRGGWKKESPRRASAGVPLAVDGPGVEPRGRVGEPASVLDLHATLLDYAGLNAGDVDSQSLRPYLEGRTDDHREVARSGLGPWQLVSDGRFDLVLGYDRERDPAMTDGLLDWLQDQPDPEATRRRLQRECAPVLFDTAAPPAERTDAAADHPGVVERLARHTSSV